MPAAIDTVEDLWKEVKRIRQCERVKLWRQENPEGAKKIARRSYAKHVDKNRERDRKRQPLRKEKDKLSRRAHYLKNKERFMAESRARYAEKREEIKAKQREYTKTHSHILKAYRERNKDREARRLKEYLAQRPHLRSAYNNKRRALEMACESSATPNEVSSLLKRATHCHYCLRKFSRALKKTLDHFVPLTKGGTHATENLVVACKSCNSSKNNKLPQEFANQRGLLFV